MQNSLSAFFAKSCGRPAKTTNPLKQKHAAAKLREGTRPWKNATMPTMKNCLQLLLIVFLSVIPISAQTTRPEAERKLAHDIYKEFVEIQSGFTTGATTPVAEAAAARLRAAGFPGSDIYVGGANPKKANIVVRYHGTGALKPVLLLAHIDVVEAKR